MKFFITMNNNVAPACLILIVAPLFFASREPAVTANERRGQSRFQLTSDKNEKYIIDTKESVVMWKCSMAVGEGGHEGFVYLSKGELVMEKNRLIGGTFEVNMNTIEDNLHRVDNNLINHLKNDEFFDVGKHPFSTFAITKVESHHADSIKVTGNLTIKDITHEIMFPAKIEVKNGIADATGKVIIDRTKWEILYGSAKLYTVLASRAISDDIELEMKVVAKR